MGNDNSGKSRETYPHAGKSPLRHVIDPAERYYDESRRKREAYDKAVNQGDPSFWPGDAVAAQPNHPVMGQEGTSQSRSGFDYRTFRRKN
jgi:hypothetical protein